MKDYVDLKLGMAQAHNDSQFAIILQRLEKLESMLASMPTQWSIFVTAASVGFAAVTVAVGTFIGIMAFGGDRFDSGMAAASVSIQDAAEAREIATRNAEEMQSIQADLDAILNLLSEQMRQ